MKYVEVIANSGSAETITAIAEKVKAHDFRLGVISEDGNQRMRLLIDDNQLQPSLDLLQHILGAQPSSRIIVLPVETALPKPTSPEHDKPKKAATTTRETLYDEIEKNSRLNINYVVLVVLSTIVAAIGLIENNVAVVIGAMVIAPLLSPNLALSLGTALGDAILVRNAIKTLLVGIVLAISLSAIIGTIWRDMPSSLELLSRTDAGLDSIALALASGAAAALSMTSGLSSVLVGVMVAVALLPPASTLGIMLGKGQIELAIGAGLLLTVNIVCVNLASKIVFFLRGVRPRTWQEIKKAQRSMTVYVLGWLILLGLLVLAIVARQTA